MTTYETINQRLERDPRCNETFVSKAAGGHCAEQ